jgi:hypothetical protein
MADTLDLQVDRSAIRSNQSGRLLADRTGHFAATVSLRTPDGVLEIEVTGREAAMPVRQCRPGDLLVVNTVAEPVAITVGDGNSSCLEWYVVDLPPWLSLEVVQAGPSAGETRVRSVLRDSERQLRPFSTRDGLVSQMTVAVDWARAPGDDVLVGRVVVAEAARDHLATVIVTAERSTRSVSLWVAELGPVTR